MVAARIRVAGRPAGAARTRVPGEVVKQEQRESEQPSHRPARRVGQEQRAPVEPDMHGFEQQGRHGEAGDQAGRHAHHDRLVEDGDPVVGPRRARPPDFSAEQPGERLPQRDAGGDQLERERDGEGAGEIANEDPLPGIEKLIGQAVEVVDEQRVHDRQVPEEGQSFSAEALPPSVSDSALISPVTSLLRAFTPNFSTSSVCTFAMWSMYSPQAGPWSRT